TTIVEKTAYVWNDAVAATATSATGTYLVDVPAFHDVEDAAGARYRCGYTSYDGLGYALGANASLRLGMPTRTDVYTSCRTAANGFTPSGQVSITHTFDASGNLLTTDDPDALAGVAAHLGCAVGGATFSTCLAYDGTFAALPVSVTNALNQRGSIGYQAP